MYSPFLRVGMVLALLLMAALVLPGRPVWQAVCVLAALIIALGHWRYGMVWRAYREWAKGNWDRVERFTNLTPVTRLLAPQHRTYHEFLRAELCAMRGHHDEAAGLFQSAIAGHPKGRPLFWARFANSRMDAGALDEARAAIRQARALDPSSFVQSLLNDLEESMAVR